MPTKKNPPAPSPWMPGHDAPQAIRRRLVGDEWEYIDHDVSEAAIMWAFAYGFDLAAFDDWIEGDSLAPEFQRQLLGFRQRALDAQQAGNEDAVDGWVLLLRLLLQRRRERQVLVPAAVEGRPFVERKGRGEGPLKRLVREVLPPLEVRLGRKATAEEVWKACAAKRRTSLRFRVHPAWRTPLEVVNAAGKRLAGWPRFGVIVSEVRRTPKN